LNINGLPKTESVLDGREYGGETLPGERERGPGFKKKKVVRQPYKVPTTLLGGAAARTLVLLHRIDANINIKVFVRCLG